MTADDHVYAEWMANEAVVLNRRTGELHYLNPVAAAVLAFVQEHGYERGVREAAAHFALDDAGRAELDALLEEMEETGILTDGPRVRTDPAEPPAHGEPRAAPG